MPYCPLCKTEDTDGFGYCRECGVLITNTESDPAKPSRATRVCDEIGSIATQALATGVTLLISGFLGTSLGMLPEFTGHHIAGIGITKNVALGMVAVSFALGWSTSPWLRFVPICIGSILTALVMAGVSDFFSNKPVINMLYWCFLSTTGIVSVICGTLHRNRGKWYLLLLPILWTVVVVAIIHLVSDAEGVHYDQMLEYYRNW